MHRVKPFHQQYMVVCIHPHSHGVIQGGWLSVRPPIQRINAHVRRRQHRAHRPRLCHRVITNHHPRIRGILRSTQCRACCQLLVTDFIPDGIRRHHPPVNLLRHPLHQFHHRLSPLAEACQNEGTPLIQVATEIIERPLHISHGIRETRLHRILPLHPRLQRDLPVIRGIKPAGIPEYIRRQFQRGTQRFPLLRIIYILEMHRFPVLVHPIPNARWRHIEHVHPSTVLQFRVPCFRTPVIRRFRQDIATCILGLTRQQQQSPAKAYHCLTDVPQTIFSSPHHFPSDLRNNDVHNLLRDDDDLADGLALYPFGSFGGSFYGSLNVSVGSIHRHR